MDIKLAFNSVSDKVEGALAVQGFKKEKVTGNDNEMVSLYTSETLAYSVVYFTDKMHMVMRRCAMTDEGPDNDWTTLATWIFDPESDTQKELDSIANDFVDNCSGASAVKRLKTSKKKKKKDADEGNADPVFLAKRFITYFPEIKEEIKAEEDCYYPFRAVTFTKASIVPRFTNYVNTASKKEREKITGLLSTQYSNGDNDTRSIITIVILNSLEDEKFYELVDYMSEELATAAKAARKFKGKTVKPEKPKKKKRTMVEKLQGMQK